MSRRLDGRNAILYGGGGRIGGTVARAFARDGAHVFLAGARATRWTPSPGTSGRPAELFAAFGLLATA